MKLHKETAIFVHLSSLTRFSDDGPQVMLSIIFEYNTLSPKPRKSQHNSSMSWVECGMTCDSIFKTSRTSLSKITKLDLDCFAILRTGTVFTMGSSHCTGKDNVHRFLPTSFLTSFQSYLFYLNQEFYFQLQDHLKRPLPRRWSQLCFW